VLGGWGARERGRSRDGGQQRTPWEGGEGGGVPGEARPTQTAGVRANTPGTAALGAHPPKSVPTCAQISANVRPNQCQYAHGGNTTCQGAQISGAHPSGYSRHEWATPVLEPPKWGRPPQAAAETWPGAKHAFTRSCGFSLCTSRARVEGSHGGAQVGTWGCNLRIGGTNTPAPNLVAVDVRVDDRSDAHVRVAPSPRLLFHAPPPNTPLY
jgi:hypothetical protein